MLYSRLFNLKVALPIIRGGNYRYSFIRHSSSFVPSKNLYKYACERILNAIIDSGNKSDLGSNNAVTMSEFSDRVIGHIAKSSSTNEGISLII